MQYSESRQFRLGELVSVSDEHIPGVVVVVFPASFTSQILLNSQSLAPTQYLHTGRCPGTGEVVLLHVRPLGTPELPGGATGDAVQ